MQDAIVSPMSNRMPRRAFLALLPQLNMFVRA
jgi:hypothetical protein